MVQARKDFTPEKAQASVRAGIQQLISSGVTTVGEISNFGHDIEILRSSGLRAVIFHEMFRDDDLARFHDHLPTRHSSLITHHLLHRPFPHAPYSCAPEFLQSVHDFCRERNLPFAMHIAESEDETKFVRGEPNGIESAVFAAVDHAPIPRRRAASPLQYLDQYGVFDGVQCTGVHMVEVAVEDIEIIRHRDLGIVLCPRSNFCLGCNRASLEKFLFHPRIGLGTDSLASNANLSMFDEMRFLRDSYLPLLGDAAAAFAIYSATLGGAKALFIDSLTGSLEPGRAADLLYLEPSRPLSDPFAAALDCDPAHVKALWRSAMPIHR